MEEISQSVDKIFRNVSSFDEQCKKLFEVSTRKLEEIVKQHNESVMQRNNSRIATPEHKHNISRKDFSLNSTGCQRMTRSRAKLEQVNQSLLSSTMLSQADNTIAELDEHFQTKTPANDILNKTFRKNKKVPKKEDNKEQTKAYLPKLPEYKAELVLPQKNKTEERKDNSVKDVSASKIDVKNFPKPKKPIGNPSTSKVTNKTGTVTRSALVGPLSNKIVKPQSDKPFRNGFMRTITKLNQNQNQVKTTIMKMADLCVLKSANELSNAISKFGINKKNGNNKEMVVYKGKKMVERIPAKPKANKVALTRMLEAEKENMCPSTMIQTSLRDTFVVDGNNLSLTTPSVAAQDPGTVEDIKKVIKTDKKILTSFQDLNTDDSTDDETNRVVPQLWCEKKTRDKMIECQQHLPTEILDKFFSVEPKFPRAAAIFNHIKTSKFRRQSSLAWKVHKQ